MQKILQGTGTVKRKRRRADGRRDEHDTKEWPRLDVTKVQEVAGG